MTLKHRQLTVPIELINYSFKNKLTKYLSCYIALKFYSDGKISEELVNGIISKALKIKAKRTINKSMNKLLMLDWIGYNPKSKNYFIRSFDFLIDKHSFTKKHAALCYPSDLNSILAFFVGAAISKELNVKKYLNVIRSGKRKAVVYKGNAAFQPNSSRLTHLGLSNSLIAEKLGCKYTRASELKKEAVENGYLKAKPKFTFLARDLKMDFNLKQYLGETHKNADRFKLKADAKGCLNLYRQEYDEMEPLVSITNRKKGLRYRKEGKMLKNPSA